ncbi:MAG: type II toxin-antitoxin system HicA family toxin [bacterium]|nr:type II toxin-antitoxin system HicA family toxin [bacterium]
MLKPVRRRLLIEKLSALGFGCPFSGGKHEYMEKGRHRIFIPNPHKREIGIVLLKLILKELGITFYQFNQL